VTELDAAGNASFMRTCETVDVVRRQDERAIALAGSFVESKGALKLREQ